MQDPEVTYPLVLMVLVTSVEFLQLRLQQLEVADGLLKGRVRAQRLQFHKVSTDVVETHVGESASKNTAKNKPLN